MKFGVSLLTDRPLNETAKMSQMAERAGIEYCWIDGEAPSAPYRDPYAAIAILGSATKKMYCLMRVRVLCRSLSVTQSVSQSLSKLHTQNAQKNSETKL